MNVILVEDNVALRGSLADYLSVNGHTVQEAGDAVELYQKLAGYKFDVAVVDINLPHHDGYSITRYLAKEQLCATIITSVRSSIEDRVKGYECGADIYMVKPVEPEELAAAIARLGTRRRAVATTGPEAPPSAWLIDTVRRCLWAPNGKLVQLTGRETLLMEALSRIEEAGSVSRDDLQAVLGEPGPSGRGRLDTMLSRLRNKVRGAADMELPLITAHNVGFSLTARIDAANSKSS